MKKTKGLEEGYCHFPITAFAAKIKTWRICSLALIRSDKKSDMICLPQVDSPPELQSAIVFYASFRQTPTEFQPMSQSHSEKEGRKTFGKRIFWEKRNRRKNNGKEKALV